MLECRLEVPEEDAVVTLRGREGERGWLGASDHELLEWREFCR